MRSSILGAGRLAAGPREAGPREAPAGLLVRDLRVAYANGAIGVDRVTLSVRPGLIVAVLGRNGAGKTSLLSGVAGFLRSERVSVTGSVQVKGVELRGASPVRTNRQGVVLVPERDKIFPSLTVAENLALVSVGQPDAGFDLTARFPALTSRTRSRAGMLSGGERQMLALAMAVAQQPQVLLVDELSLGLAPVVVKELLEALRELRDVSGISILLVEQDATAAMKVADYLYVLDRGLIAWEGEPSGTSAAELGQRYLGLPV